MDTRDMYNTIGIKEHGVYNCYDYVILTSRINIPCCYILLKEGDPYTNRDAISWDSVDISVHGGCTFAEEANDFLEIVKIKPFLRPKFVIGWDYGHLGDYCEPAGDGQKWTLDELRNEVRQAINYLVDLKGWGHYE